MQSGERDHVDGQLPQVSIELAREPEAGGDPRHGDGDQVVQVSIGGGAELQSSEYIIVSMVRAYVKPDYLKQMS